MEKINAICKLVCSAAFLILAVAALMFSYRTGVSDAHAVGVAPRRAGYIRFVFTQSPSGKILYKWEWDRKKRRWERYMYNVKGK